MALVAALPHCRTTMSPEPARGAGDSSKALKDPERLEPFHVTATSDDGSVAVDVYDAGGLFDRAVAAFKRARFEDAVALYEKIFDEFPDSSYIPLARYNSGLAKERLKDYQGAIEDYRRMLDRDPSSPDVKDALFRIAGAYEALEVWKDAVKTFDRLLDERSDLEGIERVECFARRGAALIHLGEPARATESLKRALFLFRSGTGISPSESTYYYGMARFKLGEILETEMQDIALPADEALMAPALERKCRRLLDAQIEYTHAIRIAHPHWAAAAAYRIGNLYRALWDDLLAAPMPEGLDAEERVIYLDILKQRIRVLLTKAVRQWERVLKMAERLDLKNEWVDRTRRDLDEVRRLLVLDPRGDD